MKSIVLSLLENSDKNSPYFRDYYVDYLIVKKIYEAKSDFDSLYNYLNDKYYGQAIVDGDALKYYLNINFDIDSNNYLIITDRQKEILEESINNIYKINFEDADIDELVNDVITFIQKDDIECLIDKGFKDQLINVLSIYKNFIFDYKYDFFASVYYNVLLKKDVYSSMSDEFLFSSKDYEYDINILDIFSSKELIKLFNIYKIKTVKDLLSLQPSNLVLLFPIDFKNIIDTLNLIPSKMYNSFVNKTLSFIGKLKDNYLVIIEDRIIGNKTLQEMGDNLGVTRERVRQIEAKMIRNICEIYNQENRNFISNVYNLLNQSNKLYLKYNEFFNFFENKNIKTVLICYLKYCQKSTIKYDDYYNIIYDSTKYSIDDIVNIETSSIEPIVRLDEYEKLSSIQKKYIDDNYNLKKEKIYLKKGLGESELYLRIIDTLFPDGFKINDEHDYSILIEQCKNIYDIDDVTSMRYIASMLDRNNDYCQNDRGKFINRKKLPKLPSYLFQKIKRYIADSKYVVYYSEIFNVYKEEFLSIGITNQYMLKGILDNMLSSSFKTNRDFITYGEQKTIWDGVIDKIRSYNGVFSTDDITIDFPNITYPILQGILANEMNNNGLLNLYNKNYVYANKTNINLFKDRIIEKVNSLFENSNSEFLTASKVYAKISLSADNFLTEFSFKVDEMNMYSIIKYLMPEEYIYRRPMIIKLDSDLKNTFNVISKYMNEFEEIDDQMLLKYINRNGLGSGWYYNYNSFCEYMSEDFVRVDKQRMVKKDIFNLNDYLVNQVDIGLKNIFARYNDMNLTEFKAYFVFPKIEGYEWNEYLLIGIINSYLNEKYTVYRENGNNIVRSVKDEL